MSPPFNKRLVEITSIAGLLNRFQFRISREGTRVMINPFVCFTMCTRTESGAVDYSFLACRFSISPYTAGPAHSVSPPCLLLVFLFFHFLMSLASGRRYPSTTDYQCFLFPFILSSSPSILYYCFLQVVRGRLSAGCVSTTIFDTICLSVFFTFSFPFNICCVPVSFEYPHVPNRCFPLCTSLSSIVYQELFSLVNRLKSTLRWIDFAS